MTEVMVEVCAEAARAEQRYGPFTSTHEGYGVLAEEVAELLDAIRTGNLESVRAEAIQVSAVALRLAECCGIGAFRERSGA
jgi:NTP pyrophosphatase (non-canonical NTP hydrolase)